MSPSTICTIKWFNENNITQVWFSFCKHYLGRVWTSLMIWGKKEPTVEKRKTCRRVTRTGLSPLHLKQHYYRYLAFFLCDALWGSENDTEWGRSGKSLLVCKLLHLLHRNRELVSCTTHKVIISLNPCGDVVTSWGQTSIIIWGYFL